MIDCGNSEIRELLPDMLHDTLAPEVRERVAAHMQSCAACQEEFSLLTSVYSLGRARTVDVAAITRSITPYRRRPWVSMPPLMRIAAAIAVIAVGGASYSIVNRSVGNGVAGLEETLRLSSNDTTVPTTAGVTADPAATTPDLNALDDGAMKQLLSQLEKLEADLPVEPRILIRNPRVSGN